jgi:hypothetical protein
MYIGHGLRNDKFCYSMMSDNVVKILEETTAERDLGIWMDNNLKFSVHVEQAVAKANQMLGLIKRSFEYMDKYVLKQLYTAIVRPHLEYGNVVWHPRFKKTLLCWRVCSIERLDWCQVSRICLIPNDCSSWICHPCVIENFVVMVLRSINTYTGCIELTAVTSCHLWKHPDH